MTTFPKTTIEAELQTLRDQFYSQFAPAGLEERFLVDILARSAWRQQQYLRLDTAVWNSLATGPVSIQAARDLNRISRCEEAASKSFHSALKQLRTIRSAREKAAASKKPVPRSSGLFGVPRLF